MRDLTLFTALRLSEKMSSFDRGGAAETARRKPHNSALNELAGPTGKLHLKDTLKFGLKALAPIRHWGLHALRRLPSV